MKRIVTKLVAVVWGSLYTLALLRCASTPAGYPPPAVVAQYSLDQENCALDASSRAEADICRASKRALFCDLYPAVTECGADAGAEGGDR